MAYIVRRPSGYYLNLRLPKHLFPNLHTLRMCLNLRERQAALFLATSLAQQVHCHLLEHPLTDIATLRSLCTEWRDACHTPTSINRTHQSVAKPAKAVVNGPALSTLSKLYIEEGKRGGTWREVSTREVERSLRDLFELMGDVPVSDFDVHQARRLKDRLSRCPQYFALLPQFKGKTLMQVIESGGTYKTITAVTVNNRLRRLSALMNWCKSNGYVTDNPLVGLKVMTGPLRKHECRLNNTT